ncbi:hypothetical protein ACQEVC_10680 [Plantactinospora sp. CA-294935]|uniref:8-oxoguanine DNA glycosylase OGG fold protein n=1 Tax=Plantactinospora sp. CA-294935 TaxID=3240012 RepID=UPI003D8C555C
MATAWSRRAWQKRLPEFHDFFVALPDRLDRPAVARYGRLAADGEAECLRAFLAAMVWGHGPVGYGAFRTERILRENPQAPRVLREAAQRVAGEGGAEAFAWFSANRLRHLGVSFATKYLFFSPSPQSSPALVLDSLVCGWLRQYAGCRIRLAWRVHDYTWYLQLVTGWSADLGIAPEDVEYLMFVDAAEQQAARRWVSDDRVRLAKSPVVAEAAAVLEALDEAADAFAALPGNSDSADKEFDQGIRRLRLIVLARSGQPGVGQVVAAGDDG